VHTHVLPQAYVDALLAVAADDPGLARAYRTATEVVPHHYPPQCGPALFDDVTNRIPMLDEAGVARQILGAGSFMAFGESTTHRVELTRAWNDAVTAQVSLAPDRFAMFAQLPVPDVEACLAEVARVGDRPAVAGFGLTTHVNGIPLDDERWTPLYEELDRRGTTVFVHPDGFCVAGLMDREMELEVGTQLDDTLAAVRLMRSGILARYPGITWVIAHLGGALSFLLGRLDEHWERDRGKHTLSEAPSTLLGGLYVDTAGHGPESLRFAAEILGPSKLLFGTDYPMVHVEHLGGATAQALHAIGDREAPMFRANAHSLGLVEDDLTPTTKEVLHD